MLIHCLGRGSVVDKPHTSQCPSLSVADITDCATSPISFITVWEGKEENEEEAPLEEGAP